jgi:hypothetical protein
MTTAAQYREYANQCRQWAAEASSEAWRSAFLVMAERWIDAALTVEGCDRGPLTAFRPHLASGSFGSAIERLLVRA